MTDDLTKKHSPALLVQKHQLDQSREVLGEAAGALGDLKALREGLEESASDLEARMRRLMGKCGVDPDSPPAAGEAAGEGTRFALTEEERLRARAQAPTFRELQIVDIGEDWEEYRANIGAYAEAYGLDLDSNPIPQLLSRSDVVRLEKEYDIEFGTLKWNRWDYAAVAVSVLCAFLVDFFVVAIPRTTTFLWKEYQGSPVTGFFRKCLGKVRDADPDAPGLISWLKGKRMALEEYAKVPYDFPTNNPAALGTSVEGLSPKTHRLQTLGHDPVLGFVFGIMDIFRGTMTVIGSDGKIQSIGRGQPTGFFEAIVKQVAHLLSDVDSPQGLPCPFLGVLQCLNGKSPFALGPSGEKVSFNHLSRYMYSNGFTLEHFATMSLVPLTVELMVNAYYLIANFDSVYRRGQNYSKSSDAKLQSMLCLAHTMASVGNIAKTWLMGWNPLALNVAQLLKTFHSFYALYRAKKERWEKIDTYLLDEWERLYRPL
jgi:hypothetical protein